MRVRLRRVQLPPLLRVLGLRGERRVPLCRTHFRAEGDFSYFNGELQACAWEQPRACRTGARPGLRGRRNRRNRRGRPRVLLGRRGRRRCRDSRRNRPRPVGPTFTPQPVGQFPGVSSQGVSFLSVPGATAGQFPGRFRQQPGQFPGQQPDSSRQQPGQFQPGRPDNNPKLGNRRKPDRARAFPSVTRACRRPIRARSCAAAISSARRGARTYRTSRRVSSAAATTTTRCATQQGRRLRLPQS